MKLNNIFIIHGKNYTTAYYTVEKELNEEMNNTSIFSWVNFSAPNDSESYNSNDDANKMLF